jgi:SAM-dependent methyltransferase
METNADLSQEYRQRFGNRSAYRDAVWAVLVRDFFQQFIPKNAAVLDLGAGWGEFIRHVKAARKFAMDLNPDMPSRVGSGVEAIVQDCSTPWAVPPESLDVVFTSNFFEHLPDKNALRRTMLEARRCLKPGGKLICLGPNIRFLPGTYWDFWDHHVALTDRSLVELFGLAGLNIDRCEPRFLPYSMSQGFEPPVWMLAAYLRVPFAWRVFGKQFLIVGSKQ